MLPGSPDLCHSCLDRIWTSFLAPVLLHPLTARNSQPSGTYVPCHLFRLHSYPIPCSRHWYGGLIMLIEGSTKELGQVMDISICVTTQW